MSTGVVITGVGLATCLGESAEETWRGVLERRQGMGRMPAMESVLPEGRTGGQAAELPASFMPGAVREVRYLRWVIEAALRNCGLGIAVCGLRTGVVLGTTLHGIRQGGRYLRTGDASSLSQFLGAAILKEALAGLPFDGPALTTCSACSSGLGAVALGVTMLRSGQVDVVIAGGYDPVSEYVYAGFDSLRLVAEGEPRPFCVGRDGMKVAEGYAVVVLEREGDFGLRIADCGLGESAIRNPQSAMAHILGYGESSDSHHLTQPHPEGEGAARAAGAALAMAGVGAAEIGLVSAHATSTPNNDAAEFAAISRVFPERSREVPVVAFKSHIGHTLGGAGAAELILSLMALRDQVFPPTANASELEFPVNVNGAGARPLEIGATLNLSLGFGGANAAMVLGRGAGLPSGEMRTRKEKTSGRSPMLRRVLITGVGVVMPGAVGNEAFLNQRSWVSGHLDDAAIAHLLQARRVRRMSEYVKATLAATAVAFQDAGVTDIPVFAAGASAILGTCLGSTSFCEAYYRPITKDGLSAANPMLFAEGVPNAAAAQLSLMFQVKGSCQAIIGSRTAGVDALWLAALRIAGGEWERAIVSAGEEFHETAIDVYRAMGLEEASTGLTTGAVTLVLESEEAAQARGARVRGMVDLKGGSVRSSPQGLAWAGAGLLRTLDIEAVALSCNGTWLDRVEAMAVRHGCKSRKLVGVLPDLQSATPLANLAMALLSGDPPAVGILATDYAGLAAAVRVEVNPPRTP